MQAGRLKSFLANLFGFIAGAISYFLSQIVITFLAALLYGLLSSIPLVGYFLASILWWPSEYLNILTFPTTFIPLFIGFWVCNKICALTYCKKYGIRILAVFYLVLTVISLISNFLYDFSWNSIIVIGITVMYAVSQIKEDILPEVKTPTETAKEVELKEEIENIEASLAQLKESYWEAFEITQGVSMSDETIDQFCDETGANKEDLIQSCEALEAIVEGHPACIMSMEKLLEEKKEQLRQEMLEKQHSAKIVKNKTRKRVLITVSVALLLVASAVAISRFTAKPEDMYSQPPQSFAYNENDVVYWVENGKSFHYDKNCYALAKSKNISKSTLWDALEEGKTDPCNLCAGGE